MMMMMTVGGEGGGEHTKWIRREGCGRAGKVEAKAEWAGQGGGCKMGQDMSCQGGGQVLC